MKKIAVVFLFLTLFCVALPTSAIQEVHLDIEGEASENPQINQEIIFETTKPEIKAEKTLLEKIHEINEKDYNDISKSHYLLEEILTKEFDNSIIKTAHLFGYYHANANMDFYPDDEDFTYTFNNIDVGVNGKFKNEKFFYEARFKFAPTHRYNFFQNLPSNMYIATTAIPNHTVIVGNTRTATGHEGAKAASVIPLVVRSQIARNFGNIRKVGVRVKGKYDLVEYDLGGYSSDTYFRRFFPGAEFAGWLTLKPLGKTNGKYGVLKMGSGITAGEHDSNYTVFGAYSSYEYKNFYANFEWGRADGYNGARGYNSNKAEGLYTTLAYRITPKFQLVGRYDQYRPNLNISDNMQKEYSAGINYFIKGQALKLMLNYVYCENEAKADSHRIILGTQIML